MPDENNVDELKIKLSADTQGFAKSMNAAAESIEQVHKAAAEIGAAVSPL